MAKPSYTSILSDALRYVPESPKPLPENNKPSSTEAEANFLSEQLARTQLELNALRSKSESELKGSLVASKVLDRINNFSNASASNDVRKLYKIYLEVKQQFANQNLKATNRKITRGATEFTYEFSAAVKSDEARAHARFATEAVKSIAENLNGTGWGGGSFNPFLQSDQPTIADISEQLGIYRNGLYQVAFYNDGTPSDAAVMPPYAWKVNTGPNLRFKSEDQEDAYVYFDPATWVPDCQLSPKEGIWYTYGKEIEQRYAVPGAIYLAQPTDGLDSLYSGLSKARDNSFPRTVFLRDESSVNFDQMLKLWESLPAQILAKGGKISAEQFFNILTGIKDAKILSPGTGAFNEFGDARLYKEVIALAHDLQLAMLEGAEAVNRATLEFLIRLLVLAQRLWNKNLELKLIFPAFRLVLNRLRINYKLVKCEVKWRENETPEEMAAKATFATDIKENGDIAEETCHTIQCNYLGVDPAVDNERKQKEREAKANNNPDKQNSNNQQPEQPEEPKEIKHRVRFSGMNPLSLPGQDIGTQVANALAANGMGLNPK